MVKLNHGFRGLALADEITELRLFAAIVQAGNLSAASRALNASTAAMSRGLSNLESRLGVRLVTRTTRSFELTEEGRAFYERCERIIVDIDEAEAEASSKGNSVRGNLRIGAPMEIGRRLIGPLIARFSATYPGTKVHLTLSDSGFDVIDDALDVALRVGLPSDTSVVAKKLQSTKRIVCASPEYFARHGKPQTPHDLRMHNCIRLVRGRRILNDWLFQQNGEKFTVTVNGTLSTTSGEVVHDWIRTGNGIALKATWDLQKELTSGVIVQCLEEYWCDTIDLFAICASRQNLPPRIRVFLDFIARQLPEIVKSEGLM